MSVLGYLTAQSLSRRIGRVALAAAASAEGDAEQDVVITGHDENAQMAGSVRQTVEYMREMAAAAQAVAAGDLTIHVEPRSDRDMLSTATESMVHSQRSRQGLHAAS